MDFNHSETCLHCQMRCQHPHDETDPLVMAVAVTDDEATVLGCDSEQEVLVAQFGFGIYGSRMRHGGTATLSSGLTLAGDEWVQIRCRGCRNEMMTPVETAPLQAERDYDGALLIHCMHCFGGIVTGRGPGHGRQRRRRGHRGT